MTLTLTKQGETATTITVGWANPAGTTGHEYLVDGLRVSNDWAPAKTSITFRKPDAGKHVYSVVALGLVAQGDLVWPSVVPPPDPSPWAFDATTAAVRPDSAALITAFLSYAIGKGAFFAAAVAHADAPAGTPAYPIPTSESVSPVTVPVPAGTLPGCTDDHSLVVRDLATGIQYDFGNATAGGGKITKAFGIATVQPGGVNETGPGGNNANAAKFAMLAGPVKPAEIGAGIAHTLHFSMPNVGPPPNPYPAGSNVGYPANNGLPLGSWLRLAPDAVLGAGATELERDLFDALKAHGMCLRDINPSNFSIYGTDEVNQGGNGVVWSAAGVPLPLKAPDGTPYAVKLSSAIPWAKLQVLQPPPH